MICKNCGAEFGENEPACPFCGADNFKKSKQDHDSAVQKIKDEEQEIKALPKKVANKSTKFFILSVVLFIAIGLIVALIAYGVRTVLVKHEYKGTTQLAEQLEILYQNGDYAEIYEQTRQLSSSNRTLGKYIAVGQLYNKYQLGCDTFESDLEFAQTLNRADVFSSTHYFLDVLMYCDELENNGFVYDEDAAVAYYRDAVWSFLTDSMCLTDEEITAFYDRYVINENEYATNRDYTYQMRSDEREAIDLEAGELIYERRIKAK